MDSGGQKEAQVQLYSPCGASVPSWEGTVAPPGEYICGNDVALCQITLTTCLLKLEISNTSNTHYSINSVYHAVVIDVTLIVTMLELSTTTVWGR